MIITMIYIKYALIIIIVLILLFLLIARLRIVIQYVKLDGKELFNLKLLLLGNIIKINIQIDNIINRIRIKERKIKHKKIKKRIDFDYFKKTLENIRDYYYIINKILKRANKYYKKRLICEEFTFIIDFGLEDAAITGIASGFTYGIIYNILSIINNNMILKQTEVKVNPDFNNLKLDIDFTCILSLRYVHIIIGYIIIVFSFIGSIFKIKVLSDRLNTNY